MWHLLGHRRQTVIYGITHTSVPEQRFYSRRCCAALLWFSATANLLSFFFSLQIPSQPGLSLSPSLTLSLSRIRIPSSLQLKE